eukprot:jgi/Mesvir1/20854/Mv07942-RA.1
MSAGVLSCGNGGHARVNWEELPEELLFIILLIAGIADVRTVANAARVCKRWYKLAAQERLWKQIYLAQWMLPTTAERALSWRLQHARLKALRSRNLCLEGFIPTHGYVNAICVLPLPASSLECGSVANQRVANGNVGSGNSAIGLAANESVTMERVPKEHTFRENARMDTVPRASGQGATTSTAQGSPGGSRVRDFLEASLDDDDDDMVFLPSDAHMNQSPVSPPTGGNRNPSCLVVVASEVDERHGPGGLRIFDPHAWMADGAPNTLGRVESPPSSDPGRPPPRMHFLPREHSRGAVCLAPLPGLLLRRDPDGESRGDGGNGNARGVGQSGCSVDDGSEAVLTCFVSGSRDGFVRVWEAHPQPQCLAVLGGHEGEVTAVAALPGDRFARLSARTAAWRAGRRDVTLHHVLASASRDKTVRIWCGVSVENTEAAAAGSFPSTCGEGGLFAGHADGTGTVAADSSDGFIAGSTRLCHFVCLRVLRGHTCWVSSLVFLDMWRGSGQDRDPGARDSHGSPDESVPNDDSIQQDMPKGTLLRTQGCSKGISHVPRRGHAGERDNNATMGSLAGGPRPPAQEGSGSNEGVAPSSPIILASSDGEGKLLLWDVSTLIPTTGWHGEAEDEDAGRSGAATDGQVANSCACGSASPLTGVSAAGILAAIADLDPWVPGFIDSELHVPALLALPSPAPVATLTVSGQQPFGPQGPSGPVPPIPGTFPPWHRAVRCLTVAITGGAHTGARHMDGRSSDLSVEPQPSFDSIIAGCNDGRLYIWPALMGSHSSASHDMSGVGHAGGLPQGDQGRVQMATAGLAVPTTMNVGGNGPAESMEVSPVKELKAGDGGTVRGNQTGSGALSNGLDTPSERHLAGLSVRTHVGRVVCQSNNPGCGSPAHRHGLGSADYATGQYALPISHSGWVLCTYTVGNLLITGSQDGTILVSDLESGEPLRRQSMGGVVSCLGLLADHVLVGTGGADTSGLWLYRIPM